MQTATAFADSTVEVFINAVRGLGSWGIKISYCSSVSKIITKSWISCMKNDVNLT
jgi:hypothetical protein